MTGKKHNKKNKDTKKSTTNNSNDNNVETSMSRVDDTLPEESASQPSESLDNNTDHSSDAKQDNNEPVLEPSLTHSDTPVAPERHVTAALTPSIKQDQPSRWLSLLPLLLSLLIIIALAVGAYFTRQFWQSQNTRIQQLEAQLGRQSSALSSTEQQQSSALKQQEQQLIALGSTITSYQQVVQQRLDTHAERLQALTGTDRTRWVLEEARYLLRLANQRQLTGGGESGIIGLLESSDTLLRELDVPDLFPIREAINHDILALKIAPKVDREGVYLQLSAVIDQVEQLPMIPLQHLLQRQQERADSDTSTADASVVPNQEHDHSSDSTQEPSPSFWQTFKYNVSSSLSESIGVLEQYIRIKSDHEQPLQPLMTDAQQYMMAHNLRLMLDQAQMALLREEQMIYRDSLGKTARWIDTHYHHFTERKALINHINILKELTIVSTLPDISASLVRLTQYIKYQDNLLSEEKPEAETAASTLPGSITGTADSSDKNKPEEEKESSI